MALDRWHTASFQGVVRSDSNPAFAQSTYATNSLIADGVANASPLSNTMATADTSFGAGRLVLLVFAFLVAAYPDVIVGTNALVYRDFGIFGYPLANYHRESLLGGEIPLWNPLNNCGLPFLAQWNTMVFYPLSLIYVLLPMPWSLNYFCFLHVLLAAVGMYFLARRWTGNGFAATVAGLGYALNGLTLHSLMWPNNIAALAWLPWVVFVMERAWLEGGRSLLLAALIAAVQMLSGAPEIIIFTWVIAGSLSIGCWVRHGAFVPRRILMMGALACGLSAVQLLPFLDLAFHSQRDSSFASDAWSMPAWGVANFLVPLFRCTAARLGVFSQEEQQWTSSYYAGVGILALALCGFLTVHSARVWWLGLLLTVSLLLALGNNGFVYPLIKQVIPALGMVRFPVKFVVPVLFALPMLAAFAIARLGNGSGRRLLSGVIAALLAGVAAIVFVGWKYPFPGDSWSSTWQSGVGRAVVLTLIGAAVIAWCRAPNRRQNQLWAWLLLLLLGIDILTHAPRQNPTVAARAYGPVVAPVKTEGRIMLQPSRKAFFGSASTDCPLRSYHGYRVVRLANCNLLDGVSKVDGFYSLYVGEENRLRSTLLEASDQVPTGLANFLAVTHTSTSDDLFGWTNRAGALPMISAGQSPIFATPSETLKALGSPRFDPRQVVYLPAEAKAAVGSCATNAAKVFSTRRSAHEIEIDVRAEERSVVTIAQTHYHWWKAFIDDNRTSVWRANYAFQAVVVPPGHHRVRLVYEDWSFRAGAVWSVLTLIICGLAFIHSRDSNITVR